MIYSNGTFREMCTRINKAKTQEMMHRHAQDGVKVVTFYKVFLVSENSEFMPIFQHETYQGDDAEGDGYLKAKKTTDAIEGENIVGSGAYHGFAFEEDAKSTKNFMTSMRRTAVVRKVEVPVDNIVGYSNERNEVAFSKMKILFQDNEHI